MRTWTYLWDFFSFFCYFSRSAERVQGRALLPGWSVVKKPRAYSFFSVGLSQPRCTYSYIYTIEAFEPGKDKSIPQKGEREMNKDFTCSLLWASLGEARRPVCGRSMRIYLLVEAAALAGRGDGDSPFLVLCVGASIIVEWPHSTPEEGWLHGSLSFFFLGILSFEPWALGGGLIIFQVCLVGYILCE